MSAGSKIRTIAVAVDTACGEEDIFRLAAVGAGIHAQSAAERARNAAQEGQTIDAGIGRGARDLRVGHRGAGTDALARFDRDFAEASAAEPDDDAGDAAVANDEIGAEPDDGDRNIAGEPREKIGEIGFVGRQEHDLRRTADAEPGERRQRLVRREAAAQVGHRRRKRRRDVGKAHAVCSASCAGNAAAHCVMLPAPRQTT